MLINKEMTYLAGNPVFFHIMLAVFFWRLSEMLFITLTKI